MAKTPKNHVATRVATAATVGYEHSRAKDLLGRVYEYFPSPLASAQGKKGGESAFILANPPFTILDWGGDRLRDDKRWQYGVPPAGDANFAWMQHITHRSGGSGACDKRVACGRGVA